MTLDTPDAELFDQTVSRVAADLRDLGDTTGRDERRARAVGVLADPQHALDLMSGRSDAAPSQGGTGSLDLVVHLTPDDLEDDEGDRGVAAVERRGAVSTGLLARWTGRHLAAGGRVTVRPVTPVALDGARVRAETRETHRLVAAWLTRHGLSNTRLSDTRLSLRSPIVLDDTRAVDHHDPPPLMSEQVVLRDAHCVFPGCRHDSRACDLDHIEAYVPLDQGGPPGQTTAANLAPLCRRHHNVKTHLGWTYRRATDGSYRWTSPTGHAYVVVTHSRRPLGVRRA